MKAQPTINYQEVLQEALTAEGSFSDTYCRFYNYSFRNQLLLYYQGVKEPVATYNNWKKLERQVKKGSKAKFILRPITIVDKEDPEESKTFFKYINCMFTYSETDGEDKPLPELPKWHIATACEELGIKEVSYSKIDGNTQGYAKDKQYAINPTAKYPLKTTLHEIAHIVLGHTTSDQLQEYQTHRGIKEFQAEATAYLILKDLKADSSLYDESESRAYIQQWLGNTETDQKHIKEIIAAVDKILKAGRKE